MSIQEELLRDAAMAGGSSGSGEPMDGQQLQMKILEQLQKVTARLNQVKDRMATTKYHSTLESKLSKDSLLESIKGSKVCKKPNGIETSSSSDDSATPSMALLKSRKLQKKVDKHVRELEQSSHVSDEETHKLKSQRGGGVEVLKTKGTLAT